MVAQHRRFLSTDSAFVKGQPFFLPIYGYNLCLLSISVVVRDKLNHVIHIEVAWQFMPHFSQAAGIEVRHDLSVLECSVIFRCMITYLESSRRVM